MVFHLKATLNIDDRVRDRLKQEAVRQGRTIFLSHPIRLPDFIPCESSTSRLDGHESVHLTSMGRDNGLRGSISSRIAV